MRDPSTWGGMLPVRLQDRIAMGTIFIAIPLSILFECFIVIPYYTDYGSSQFYYSMALVLFLVLNYYGNLYKVITVNSSGVNSDLPSVLRAGFRYCSICKVNCPPRAYHCPTCDICIWKRDHHCSFAATCVGFKNHRYYLMAVLYGFLGVTCAVWWHFYYVWECVGGLRLGTVWFAFVPHIALITQFISIKQFILLGFQVSSIIALLFSGYLLGAQLMCIGRGQTRPEFLLGIQSFDLGPLPNFRAVLGRYWLLAVVCPFLPSPLEGDGTSFERRTHKLETVKDI